MAKKEDSGAPGWIVTFADLMSLLLTFFVLLISMAEMNIEKYKAVAGSMRNALGVRANSQQEELPTSDVVNEQQEPELTDDPRVQTGQRTDATKRVPKRVEREFHEVEEELSPLVKQSLISVERQGNRLILRIQEKGAFDSGRAELNQSYLPVLDEVRKTLEDVNVYIAVTGHTDDVPISNQRFRSNWELSASRAVSVVHHLLKDGTIPIDRVVVQGYGASRPLAPNKDAESRARNRRVEIVLVGLEDLPGEQTRATSASGDGKADGTPASSQPEEESAPVTEPLAAEPAPAESPPEPEP